MKSIFTLCGIVFYSILYSQTTYTFHTAGNWTDAANWSPSYPGTSLDNSTININANCNLDEDLAIISNNTININAQLIFIGNFRFIEFEVWNSVNNIINITNMGLIQGSSTSYNHVIFMAVLNTNTILNNGNIDNIYVSTIGAGGNTPDIIINNGSITNSLFESCGMVTNNGSISGGVQICGSFTNYGTISSWVNIHDGGICSNNGSINSDQITFRRFENGTQPTLTNNGTILGNTLFTNPVTNGFTCNPIFTNNGHLSPGNSPGKINFNLLSPYNGCPNIGIYDCEINGISPITLHDQITVTNCANLSNATLNVTWGFTPSVGQEFDIITHGSRTGQFAAVNIPPISGLNFTVDYSDPSKTSIVVSSALPVTWLSSPTANIKNNNSHISWSIASQINNSHFIIEHSTDGRSYSEIGNVQGHGTLSTSKIYKYIHETPSIGINYYRIKQVDYDGQSDYSDVVSVVYESDGSDVRIYPNPVSSDVTITTTEPTSVQVMDVYGRLLNTQDTSKGQNTINVSELPTGILIFVVGDKRYKVLKE